MSIKDDESTIGQDRLTYRQVLGADVAGRALESVSAKCTTAEEED